MQAGLGCVVVLENNLDGGVYLCLTIYGNALDGSGPRESLPASRTACDCLDGPQLLGADSFEAVKFTIWPRIKERISPSSPTNPAESISW